MAAAAFGISRLEEEEDLLVFLPTNDADVRLFKDVSKKFGGLRVALIGVEAPAGQDVFSAEILGKIQRATNAVKNVHGVDNIVSLSSVADVVASPMGAKVEQLVQELPKNAEEQAALKKKALSREMIAGNVVSTDGTAALIMVFLADGVSDRQVTGELRKVAEKELEPLKVYYGGAPFAGVSIYEEAQADVRKLSPASLLVLLLVVVLAFRDPVGVLLTITSVVLAVVVVLGGMGYAGIKWTVASSTLPVLLFASGSSFAVHVLGRYYILRSEGVAGTHAVRGALSIVWTPVLIAGGTTAIGFFSFVATDVAPMRAFGIGCGAGVLLCWLVAMSLVPAIVTLFPRKGEPKKERQLAWLGDVLVWLWNASARKRWWVIVSALVLGIGLVRSMSRVSVRMDPSSFFSPGSSPWLAERFMEDHFGGAHFMQLAVHGDLDDPSTLREIARLEDYTRSLPGVVQVSSILSPVKLVNDAMGGGKRLPATSKQSANLYFFLAGQPGISQLLGEDRQGALIQVRMRGDPHEAVAALEKFATESLRPTPAPPTREELAQRMAWAIQAEVPPAARAGLDPARLAKTLKVLSPPGDNDPQWTEKRRQVVRAYLAGEDAIALDAAAKQKLERAVVESADWAAVLAQVAPSKEDGEMAAGVLGAQLADERRNLAVERALPLSLEAAGLGGVSGELGDRLRARLWPIVDDAFLPKPDGAAKTALSVKVAGEPILERGFSRSVEHNQNRSLAISVAVVYLLLLGLFRSPRLAAVTIAPCLLALIVIFGVMGQFDVHIDLGTSLVAGITTGAGSDFAMHYMWYLRRESADEVSRTVGPINLIGVGLVSVGFFILALGNSPVMRLFGTLAGAGMALSALFTCLLVPALLNKVEAGGSPTSQEERKS